MRDCLLPFNCDLKQYELRLATRDFWDDLGHEWTYKTFEEKLVILAGFVKQGGDLKRVIERYAEDRSEIYRSRIHWVIFNYIWRLMMPGQRVGRPTSDRIKCLSNNELTRLLSELLQDKVNRSFKSVAVRPRGMPNSTPHYEFVENWVIDSKEIDDTILDRIEREHWKAYPDESFSSYLWKAKRWEHKYCLF